MPKASIFEAIEACLHHFGGAPKELLVDNAKALVTDANPTHFRWNPQFLELCGHYRLQARACQPYRAQTKGKIESGVKYVKRNGLAGRSFDSFAALEAHLAAWTKAVDERVHGTTNEKPSERFEPKLLRQRNCGRPAARRLMMNSSMTS